MKNNLMGDAYSRYSPSEIKTSYGSDETVALRAYRNIKSAQGESAEANGSSTDNKRICGIMAIQ